MSNHSIRDSRRTFRFDERNVLVAHHARHHLYNTADAYLRIGRLAGFATQTYEFHSTWSRFVKSTRFPGVAGEASRCSEHYDHRLVGRVCLQCPTWGRYLSHQILGSSSCCLVRAPFQQWVSSLVAKLGCHCHTHCTGALEVFKVCKLQNSLCILEQYIGDRRLGSNLLLEECQLHGLAEAKGVLEAAGFTPDKIEINEQEYALADAIVAGSPFVVETLKKAGVMPDKIVLAPYGVSAEWLCSAGQIQHRHAGEPLQVAFVGNDFIRKGLAYALKAVGRLGNRTAHLNIFGSGKIVPFLNLLGPCATYHGGLSASALKEALLRCHAFVLPSLWEGSSLAVYEALAQGLPSVVTPNTGAMVTNGYDGFTVPIRSPEAIEESLWNLLDESKRQTMANNARQTAMRYTWDAYGRNLVEGLGIGQQIAGSSVLKGGRCQI